MIVMRCREQSGETEHQQGTARGENEEKYFGTIQKFSTHFMKSISLGLTLFIVAAQAYGTIFYLCQCSKMTQNHPH